MLSMPEYRTFPPFECAERTIIFHYKLFDKIRQRIFKNYAHIYLRAQKTEPSRLPFSSADIALRHPRGRRSKFEIVLLFAGDDGFAVAVEQRRQSARVAAETEHVIDPRLCIDPDLDALHRALGIDLFKPLLFHRSIPFNMFSFCSLFIAIQRNRVKSCTL